MVDGLMMVDGQLQLQTRPVRSRHLHTAAACDVYVAQLLAAEQVTHNKGP